MTHAITWVPSKKAREGGFPVGVNPDVDYNMPASPNFADGEVPFVTLIAGATRAYRHALNNEARSALDKALPNGTDEQKAEWLHEYRMECRDEWMAGMLGVRTPSERDADVGMNDVDKEANNIAFNIIKAKIVAGGGTYNYNTRTAKSLAVQVEGEKTMGDLIVFLLTRAKIRHDILAQAQKTVDERRATIEAAAAESDEGQDNFGFEEDEAA